MTDRLEPLLSSPYVQTMGVRFDDHGDELTGILPYAEELVGNPLIPALHGGAIGAFMEITASAALMAATRLKGLPKPIDVAVDYLRPGRPSNVYARAVIAREGSRVANVRVEAWQGRRAAPIATLHGHFLIKPEASAED
ncbi:thioesterase [Marinicauda salina]|uniref:Thioesterase n=1 Tax=Marinicauda salina TaxID=2135793 RepID=A0A2U2BXZ2_9PROT|nr:PaaI family thioesterase [Marinicauda salina]PWE18870.1 thioesterase [Marinicauda salina]